MPTLIISEEKKKFYYYNLLQFIRDYYWRYKKHIVQKTIFPIYCTGQSKSWQSYFNGRKLTLKTLSEKSNDKNKHHEKELERRHFFYVTWYESLIFFVSEYNAKKVKVVATELTLYCLLRTKVHELTKFRF